MDAQSCRDHRQQDDLIRAHITSVRAFFNDPSVPIVFIPENMTGFFHTRMEDVITREFWGVHTLYQNNGPKAGICKNEAITADYVRTFNATVHNGALYLHPEWFTTGGTLRGYETKEALAAEWRAQLLRYGVDEHGKFTGKYGGQHKDDICIATMMLLYWRNAIERPGDQVYRRWRFIDY